MVGECPCAAATLQIRDGDMMPETRFGLSRPPFDDVPDTDFLFETPAWSQTLADATETLVSGRGGILLTAPPGMGKSLWGCCLRDRLATLHGRRTAWLHRESAGRTNLLRDVFHVLKLEPPRHFDDARAIAKLRRDLAELLGDDRRAILLIDGAEQLCAADLPRMAMLVQLAEQDRRLLDIVLLARPGIEETLQSKQAVDLCSHIAVRLELVPFSMDETTAYLDHRLRASGSSRDDLIDTQACKLIHELGAARPGRINDLVRIALARAAREGKKCIDGDVIRELADWPDRASRRVSVPPGSKPRRARTCQEVIPTPEIGMDRGRPGAREDARPTELASEPQTTTPLIPRQDDHMSEHSSAIDSVETAACNFEQRLATILEAAERRAAALEERLLSGNDEESNERTERLGEACERALQVEQRLSSIAEQLADRIEQVQEQVSGLLASVDAGESTRAALERGNEQFQAMASSTIELAGRVRGELDVARQELSKATADAQRASSGATESARRADTCCTTMTESLQRAESILAKAMTTQTSLATQMDESREFFRQQLDATTASLARQLENAASESLQNALASLRTESGKVLMETRADIKRAQGECAAEIREQIRNACTESQSMLGRSESAAAELAARVSTQIEEMRSRADEIHLRLSGAAGESHAAINRTESAIAMLVVRAQEKLAKLQGSLQECAERRIAECDEHMRGLRDDHAAAAQGVLARIDETVAMAEQQMSSAASRVQSEWVQSVAAQRTAVQKLHEQAGTLIAQLSGETEAAEAHLSTIRTNAATWLQDLDGDVERAHAGLQQSVSRILDEAHERRSMLESSLRGDCERIESLARANVASIAVMIEENVANARRMNDDLADALSRRVDGAKRELAELDAYCYRIETVSGQMQTGLAECEVSVGDLEQRIGRSAHSVEDLSERAAAARQALHGAVDDAHQNLMRVSGTASQLEALQASAHQTLVDLGATSEQVATLGEQLRDAHRLIARLASSCDQSKAADESLRGLIERSAKLNQAIQAGASVADDRLGRLDSHNAAATEIVRRLGESTVTGHALREKLEETSRACESRVEQSVLRACGYAERLEELTEECRGVCKRAAEQAEALREGQSTAALAVEEIRRDVEPARELAETLGARVAQSRDLTQVLQRNLREAEDLTARLDTLTGLLRSARDLDGTVRGTIQEGTETREALESAIHDATRRSADLADAGGSVQGLLDTYERVRRDANALIAHLTDQLDSAQTAAGSTGRLLDEFLTQSRNIAEQLADLAHRESTLEQRVGSLLARPEEVVAEAHTQADQLEHVCSAVKKVFTGLSRATLDARKECQSYDTRSREAAQRLEELRAQTNQAAATLREWVEEARHVQTRLERAIADSPSLRQTHPADTLEALARTTTRSAVANASAFGDRYASSAVQRKEQPATGQVVAEDDLPQSEETLASVSVSRGNVPLGPIGMDEMTAPKTEAEDPNAGHVKEEADSRAAEIDALLADARRTTGR